MPSKNGQIRPGTYWIGEHTGYGDKSKFHGLKSGKQYGYTKGFLGINKSDIPIHINVVDMPFLDGSSVPPDVWQNHWDDFAKHIVSGECVHLTYPQKKKSKKSKGEKTVKERDPNKETTVFLLEQQLKPEYWDWSDAPDLEIPFHNALERKDTAAIGCLILVKLSRSGYELSDFYLIIHDKDVESHVYDDVEDRFITVFKPPHIHAVGHYLKPKRGISPVRAAKALGIEDPYVLIPKDDNTTDNKMAYLIHFKDLNKHQYDMSEVVTLLGCSYKSYAMEHMHSWEVGRAKKSINVEEVTVDVDWLAREVAYGRITKEMIALTDAYYNCYNEHEKKIDTAIRHYQYRQMAELVAKFDRGEFTTSFVYVQGASRMGKSTLAACVCNALRYRFSWKLDDLAATNALDDYTGKDIILIDDASAAAMTGKAWLNLIDPYHAHPAPGRFKNKPRVAPRVVIITSTKDPVDFFYFASALGGDRNEAMTQFIARIMHSALVLDFRDFWNVYNVTLPSGVSVDTSYYNIEVQQPRMLLEPYCHDVEVKSRTDSSPKTERVEISAKLTPIQANGVSQLFSPIGAMLQLVRDIEERNPFETTYGTYEELRDNMGVYYQAAIEDSIAKYGYTNLLMPANYMELPDSIDITDSPSTMKQIEDEKAKEEREKLIDIETAKRSEEYRVANEKRMAEQYAESQLPENRVVGITKKAISAFNNDVKVCRAYAAECMRKIELRKLCNERLRSLSNTFFALKATDEVTKRLEMISHNRDFVVTAVRTWLGVNSERWMFEVKSDYDLDGNTGDVVSQLYEPSEYDVLLAFKNGYEALFSSSPFDLNELSVCSQDITSDELRHSAANATIVADDLVSAKNEILRSQVSESYREKYGVDLDWSNAVNEAFEECFVYKTNLKISYDDFFD